MIDTPLPVEVIDQPAPAHQRVSGGLGRAVALFRGSAHRPKPTRVVPVSGMDADEALARQLQVGRMWHRAPRAACRDGLLMASLSASMSAARFSLTSKGSWSCNGQAEEFEFANGPQQRQAEERFQSAFSSGVDGALSVRASTATDAPAANLKLHSPMPNPGAHG